MTTGAYAAPPLEAYGRLPAIESVTLSPSGERFALVGRNQDRRILTVIGPGGRNEYVNTVGTARVEVSWVGEETLFVLVPYNVQWSEAGLPNQVWNAGLIIDLKNGEIKKVFDKSSTLVDAVFGQFGARKIEGKWYVFVGGVPYAKVRARNTNVPTYPELYRVDISTGAYSRVVQSGDGHRIWILALDGSVVGSSRYDLKGRTQKIYFGEPSTPPVLSRSTDEGELKLLGLGRALDSLLVEDRTTDQKVLREIRRGGPPEGEILFSGSEAVETLRDPVTNQLIGIQRPEGVLIFNPRQQNRFNATAKAFPDARTSLEGFTADLGRMVVKTEGAKDPGTYWLVDISKGSADPIGVERPGVTAADLGPVRTFEYKAADGLALDGLLTLPPGASTKPPPLLVWVDTDRSRAISRFNPVAQAFASRGYAVFEPNPRGTMGYGETFRKAGEGEVGKKRLTDVSDGVAAMGAQGLIDSKRVCIAGSEQGGYMALAGVTLQQGVYRCAVSIGGLSDLYRFADWAREMGGSDDMRFRTKHLAAMGDVADEDLKSISPAEFAEQAAAPILLIHAEEDPVVPVAQSREMAKALKSAGKPVELEILPPETLAYSSEATVQKLLADTMAFVQKHNPAN